METITKPRVEVSLGRKSGYATNEDSVKRIIERVCFPVEKVEDASVAMGYMLQNAFTGQKISEVSKEYALIPNKRILMPFIEHFGYGAVRKIATYGGGKYLHVEFDTAREFDFGSGDIIKERLIVQNSYDKTRAFSFMLGAWRMVCSNGLYGWSSVGASYHKIHVGDIPVEGLIEGVLSRYHENAFDLWRDFAMTPMTLEEELALAHEFKAFEEEGVEKGYLYGNRETNNRIISFTEQVLKGPESVNNARSAWGLFNQLNFAVSKVVDGNSQVNKRILGTKNAERFVAERTGHADRLPKA